MKRIIHFFFIVVCRKPPLQAGARMRLFLGLEAQQLWLRSHFANKQTKMKKNHPRPPQVARFHEGWTRSSCTEFIRFSSAKHMLDRCTATTTTWWDERSSFYRNNLTLSSVHLPLCTAQSIGGKESFRFTSFLHRCLNLNKLKS